MKKQLSILGVAALLAFTAVMPVKAADSTVKFTSSGTLDTPTSLGDAFKGMAPGEKKELNIEVKNENNNTADFYMSTEVVDALEKAGKGAGYDVKLSVGGTTLYDSTVGGYDGSGAGSTEGLKELNNGLKDSVLIATLAKGASTNIVLEITMDGEGVDKAGYAAAFGEIDFSFKAGYEDPTGTYTVYRVVTKTGETKYVTIRDQKVALAAQTGDTFFMWGAAVVVIAGAVMVILGLKRKAAK
ncbi:MAG: hypothetical protein IKY04_03380 [Lachnospiraceae bacterium]|nr:hypothetical protein [Lachnospiraceae bacterium]MBR5943813.1 hypothetical protein [Lachnospiraceae bacterium]